MLDHAEYWEARYQEAQTGWDLNGPTPALQAAAEAFPKDARILIPGCGLGWDGEALHRRGYTEVYLSDWAHSAKTQFLERVPDFSPDRFITGDFFSWAADEAVHGQFDCILECTFYCAIPPVMRANYARAMERLLRPGGQLLGLLFTFPLTEQGPPFGGSVEEYQARFSAPFQLDQLGPNPLSIASRAEKEVFFCATLQPS